MADKKISELTNITGANLADNDEFVVVDTSANETKAVTRAEMFKNVPSVGIGTSSPESLLEVVSGGIPVVGVRSIAATGFSQVMAAQDDYYSGPSFGNVYIRRYNDSATGTHLGVSAANLAVVGALNPDNLVIGVNGVTPIIFSTQSTERMRIASSGNVGIGTSSPGSKLSIVGLPTSSAGLSAGDIWNDGGTLKIV